MSSDPLHKALQTLRPKSFSDIPLGSDEELATFLRDIFAKAELIANSVPPPPGGQAWPHASLSRKDTTPNSARKASELTTSEARSASPAADHAGLRSAWGKPVKLNARDNPLGMSVFKMAGSDRHGAWFARSSVHEGLGFAKWKRGMLREFAESLAVQGGPGEGNVRGIGGDTRLEERVIEGVGKLEILLLSAQFPGPTTPREFVTLLLTSDTALGEKSKLPEEGEGGGAVPRHFLVVSIPTDHPGAPPREGLIRGSYESVEMIREVPVLPVDPAKPQDAERNPVEWVMITRSDPGGGIPRFMVERSTPASIVQDAGKFLDWACAKTDLEEGPLDVAETAGGTDKDGGEADYSADQANGHLAGVGESIVDQPNRSLTAEFEPKTNEKAAPPASTTTSPAAAGNANAAGAGGIFSNLVNTVEAGLASYAPESVTNYINRFTGVVDVSDASSLSSDSSSSLDSDAYASADEHLASVHEEMARSSDPRLASSESVSLAAPEPAAAAEGKGQLGLASSSPAPSGRPSSTATGTLANQKQEKELAKLERKRARLETKLAVKKAQEERKVKEVELKVTEGKKKAEDLAKAREKQFREVRKQEERFAREAEKLDLRRTRVLEETETEGAGGEERELRRLRELVGVLQRENTLLVRQLGRVEGGDRLLAEVKREVEREWERSGGTGGGVAGRGRGVGVGGGGAGGGTGGAGGGAGGTERSRGISVSSAKSAKSGVSVSSLGGKIKEGLHHGRHRS